MTAYRWQTSGDVVLVDTGAGELEAITMSPEYIARRTPIEPVERWIPLARAAAEKHGVPLHVVLAVIWAESGGEEGLVSSAGAVGLMQVMPQFHPLTAEELNDAATNIDYGTSLYSQSFGLGYDLPEAASRYNAGYEAGGDPHPCGGSNHPCSKRPWGVRENPGYIEHVVRASNFFHRRTGGHARSPWEILKTLFPFLAAASVTAGVIWKRRK